MQAVQSSFRFAHGNLVHCVHLQESFGALAPKRFDLAKCPAIAQRYAA